MQPSLLTYPPSSKERPRKQAACSWGILLESRYVFRTSESNVEKRFYVVGAKELQRVGKRGPDADIVG
jgi:hypothetical protein